MGRKKYSLEKKQYCKSEYEKGCHVCEIAVEAGVPSRTIYNWIKKQGWMVGKEPCVFEMSITQRMTFLVNKENKSQKDFNELEQLSIIHANYNKE